MCRRKIGAEMKCAVAAIVLLSLSAAAWADIIEWQDANGVRHYTNLQAEIPKEQQPSARVVVDELARRAPASGVTEPRASEAAAQPPEGRREAQVVYDRSEESRAYLEGLERGLAVGRSLSDVRGGDVQINGPLAVARASRPMPSYIYPPPYPLTGYYPFVTTSFDRGRSRHLTLRMLLQDQFAIDREAPFVFAERLGPPFGYPVRSVDLNPFLPRGLPHGFPRRARVIVR